MKALTGLFWACCSAGGNVAFSLGGRGKKLLGLEPVGTQVASQVFIAARACVCTAWIVTSTLAEATPRSEQWKPSDNAMGCRGVLLIGMPSAETVACNQGSPRTD